MVICIINIAQNSIELKRKLYYILVFMKYKDKAVEQIISHETYSVLL